MERTRTWPREVRPSPCGLPALRLAIGDRRLLDSVCTSGAQPPHATLNATTGGAASAHVAHEKNAPPPVPVQGPPGRAF